MMASPMSPASSPRLPSPPPIAEDQIGPKSPLAGLMDDIGKLESPEDFSQGASRRIRPGTRAADMPEGPPLVELTEGDIRWLHSLKSLFMAKWLQIDTAFQLTEHLKALYNDAIHPNGSGTIVPVDRATAIRLSQPPDGVEKALWLYELCRFLCQKINLIIVALFADEPPCSAQTCPEMRASEWQYLCAVHDPPKPCCAIDYCCHTLDWAANILTSPKHFPSRLSLNAEGNQGHQPLRQLTNIFRRVYRIFAHAWFQHRELFWRVENKTGLYILFKTVCDMYGLIPEENYTVPPEAEGLDPVAQEPQLDRRPTVLQKGHSEHQQESEQGEADVAGNVTIATGHTTKRHRQPGTSETASIATVIEENEENEEEEKPEPPAEDSTEMETPVAPQHASEHSAFASAVQGHPETPEEKEPEEVEAAFSSLTLAEPTEHLVADDAETEEPKAEQAEEAAAEGERKEEAAQPEADKPAVEEAEPQVETADSGADAKDAEEAGKSTED